MTIYCITNVDYKGRIKDRYTTTSHNNAVDFIVNHCVTIGDFYRYFDAQFLYCIDGVPNSSEGSIDVELGDFVVDADAIVSKLVKDVKEEITNKNIIKHQMSLKDKTC